MYLRYELDYMDDEGVTFNSLAEAIRSVKDLSYYDERIYGIAKEDEGPPEAIVYAGVVYKKVEGRS